MKTHHFSCFVAVSIVLMAVHTPVLGLSDHFNSWLTQNGYGEFDFERTDLESGSFGGRNSDNDAINKIPIVFVHGNSDIAAGTKGWQRGFSFAMQYLMEQGYTEAEMYATSWGPANLDYAQKQYHSKLYLTRIRTFIQAVLKYTGAPKVHVVSHSMGVTLARKAIKGGFASDLLAGGGYELGASLAEHIDTFIGIAGGNWGLAACYFAPTEPACAPTNGFYPGIAPGVQLSALLYDLNYRNGKEAANVFSIYSTEDSVLTFGGIVWGKHTSKIPNQDGEISFKEKPWTHLALRDYSGPMIYHLTTKHETTDFLPELVKYIKAERGNEIDTYLGKGNSSSITFEHIYP